ncbi:MAG: sigma factor-like helix-turn-helix DNA-binding protein, partial [Bacteroidota bacterium]
MRFCTSSSEFTSTRFRRLLRRSSCVSARLQQAIEQLPAKQKTVFCLRYFEEQSYQAMSDLLGTS